jgi:hypothetical protein
MIQPTRNHQFPNSLLPMSSLTKAHLLKQLDTTTDTLWQVEDVSLGTLLDGVGEVVEVGLGAHVELVFVGHEPGDKRSRVCRRARRDDEGKEQVVRMVEGRGEDMSTMNVDEEKK